MPTRRSRSTQSVIAKASELAVAVPQVVAHRVARMAAAGPTLSARDRKEFERMIAEKSEAFSESWNAMAAQAVLANQALAASFLRSFSPNPRRGKAAASAVAKELQKAALGIVAKGLEPVHRKAVANAKRLAKTKLR